MHTYEIRERLKRRSRNDPYPKGALYYNSVAYDERGEEIYSGDMDEQVLADIRNVSKSMGHGKCITIIREHDMSDGKPFLVACAGRLYKVEDSVYKLPYEKQREVEMRDEEFEARFLGNLFG